MDTPPSVYIKTYGCQMNVRDSEQVARQLEAKGYRLTDSESDADVILINTCSVRDMAEQKALGSMANLQRLRRRKPHLIMGFMGCMAQSRGATILDTLPDVDLIIGTQKFHRVVDYIEDLRSQPSSSRAPIVDVDEEPDSQNTIKDHLLRPNQVSAYVSIMQGCNMHCTFCIVPSTRGPERSRPISEIVAEVKSLADQGIKEVTLLGQIVNLYGRHEFPSINGKTPFVQLLEAVCAVPGIERVRFTSPHPIGYKKDLIAAFSYLPQLCEHVHLPLQSGSNRILKAMHRGYTREKFISLVQELRSACPDLAISTDIIVGFPGETEEDFQATCELVQELRFDQSFIFRYSPRRNTPAAALPNAISEEEKLSRNHRLLAIQDKIALEKGQALIGQTVEILVEGESKNNPKRFQGRTRTNRLVLIEANERWRGQLLNVTIKETPNGYTFYADPYLVGFTSPNSLSPASLSA
ncbi:MAG: tRNA (N6-isopentenyl adenosine(37)-C2)-methylthiotransferase MiaB [Methylacidiphilales bacterium]|nr:tRNA (N6-isopentenyl adenosine(37)-C2)-methylthiotransferase MiaB [Candidatus Methylacidiphilales bacterium]MDW8349291.1 tRNA (N6-isopentenyl adenosine(37)-C2)-methylthiotransferase MiaB [Verrucomicrobiae bacterium]